MIVQENNNLMTAARRSSNYCSRHYKRSDGFASKIIKPSGGRVDTFEIQYYTWFL